MAKKRKQQLNMIGCTAILQSGAAKGKGCGRPGSGKPCLCGIHKRTIDRQGIVEVEMPDHLKDL